MKDEKVRNDEETRFPGQEKEEQNTILKFQKIVEKHGKTITTVSLVVIAAVVLLYLYNKNANEEFEADTQAASLALSRIVPYHDSLDYQHALYGDTLRKIRDNDVVGLISIVDDYESTKPAKLAAFYAGDCYLSQEKYDEAIKYFEIALHAESNVLLAGAHGGLGVCYEHKGQLPEAIKHYEEAAKLAVTPDIKNRYLVFAAILLEDSDKEKAINIYKEIVAENKSPEYVGFAKAGLVKLGEQI